MKNLLVLTLVLVMGVTQAEIQQSLGVDQSIDYASLAKHGPWDDRNYQITQEDLTYLPEKDHYLHNVPLFYKLMLRKMYPDMGHYYPKSTLQVFRMQYGGLLKDGIWDKRGVGKNISSSINYGKFNGVENRAINDNEVVLSLGDAEMTVEMKPQDNMIGVAGINGNPQQMFYTADGGISWTKSQDNPGNSCCDPTVDWSFTGLRVYQAELGDCGSLCNIKAAFSDDNGVTWSNFVTVEGGQNNDKEFIHVDRSATSPFLDNVYLTWHKNNIMQFSRSTDMGVTWDTAITFFTEPEGIGSDITTDAAGNIYYFYASLTTGTGMRVLKSTDGGVTFGTGITIDPLNDVFDFPIPAMDERLAFIYASADLDVNTQDLYVAWTEQTDDSGLTNNATENHSWIQVAKSTDAGSTWSVCEHPHDSTDLLAGTPVDRFHPWLKVGENGVVHIGYYDTRNSPDRTGVDFFYAYSTDGCTSWSTEERVSSVTSDSLGGFEWGDYNGLSVVLDKLAFAFADNRPTQGLGAMVVTGVNPAGSPTFNLSTNDTIEVCATDSSGFLLNVDGITGYDNDVTLSLDTTPSFVSNVVFSINPVTASGTSDVTFDTDASGVTGVFDLIIQGQGAEEAPAVGLITKTLNVAVNYSADVSAAVTLTSPADVATNVSTAATFTWSADINATAYRLMVSDDPGFGTLLVDETLAVTTFDASGLPADTQLYWKVATQSMCNLGGDVESSVFSFTTEAVFCFAPTLIPDNNSAGVDITLPVTTSGTIDTLMVTAKSDHTWPGDLIFTLSHGGTSVIVMDRPGVPASGTGCSQNGIDVLFDDASGTPVEGVCETTSPGITGTLAPEEPLSGFSGAEFSGDWVLNVSDNASFDTGTITEFCLLPTLGVDTDLIFEDGFEGP